MNFAKLALASVALVATPALANDQVVAGATVTGPEGNAVGTIVSVENGQAVLDTGKHQVPIGVDRRNRRGRPHHLGYQGTA